MESGIQPGIEDVKTAILQALAHSEAADGLFLWNFSTLHEEDERPRVLGDKNTILSALNELIQEGRIRVSEEVDHVVFKLESEVAAERQALCG